ncbi:MAG: carboxymuconolactone decarboxylase family protein [Paludibacter sp.]|jgi:4-carboxymuconolactone decarboxylase|nr:carboxymuconolactone decarboxylase family protein [Paludibacter sp.]
MKKIVVTLVLLFITVVPVFTQENKMDRIELCKKNYAALFGGEALSGQGTDPEMMDLLQKFIFGEVFQTGNLDIKTREMITCVTLTTMQTLPQLKAHIGASLNIGITPIEVRESIYLCAPFIGFPKTLNALATANEVFKEQGIVLPLEKQGMVNEQNRGTKGAEIQQPLYGDAIKKALKDLPDGLGDDVARFLTEYGFGDIYTRGGLDLKTKELLVYAVITTLEADSQLRSHTLSNIKLGNDKSTLTSVVIQCLPYIGFPAAMKTLRIIQETKEPDTITGSQKVRLAKIVVDQARLNEYNSYLKEEIESSMRLEPGVLTLYATFEKERPNRITILEIYANEEAYQSHIKTPHFLKYKQGTLDMVQELELIDSTPLIEDMKIK